MKCKLLYCPLCHSHFSKKGDSLVCENKHSFDIAKEGYVNLLPCNKKNSKAPGDNKASVVARELFLSKNFFSPLVKRIIQFVDKYCPNDSSVLDAGCGTGYYIRHLPTHYNRIGVDISKDALRIASKKDSKTLYIVASAFELPVFENSIDCILNIFAPKPNEEFLRILPKSGVVLEVIPGEKHLYELKQLLYDNPKLNRVDVKSFNLKLEKTHELSYIMELEQNDLLNLFSMTPFFFRTKKVDTEKLESVEKLSVTFDFIIKIWRKTT